MSEIEKSILYDGCITRTIKGADYQIKPLPVSDVIKGTLQKTELFLPHDKQNLGKYQIHNLMDEKRRAALDHLMQKHLFRNGEPMSLEAVGEAGWDVVDVGIFLDGVMLASG